MTRKPPSKEFCLKVAECAFYTQDTFGNKYWEWLFRWGWHKHWVENYWYNN